MRCARGSDNHSGIYHLCRLFAGFCYRAALLRELLRPRFYLFLFCWIFYVRVVQPDYAAGWRYAGSSTIFIPAVHHADFCSAATRGSSIFCSCLLDQVVQVFCTPPRPTGRPGTLLPPGTASIFLPTSWGAHATRRTCGAGTKVVAWYMLYMNIFMYTRTAAHHRAAARYIWCSLYTVACPPGDLRRRVR